MRRSILSGIGICLVLSVFSQNKKNDSLAGFDVAGALEHASHLKTSTEKNFFLEHAKRTYKIKKYNLYPVPNNSGAISNSKPPVGGIGVLQGPQPVGCANVDFEQGNTATWNVQGDFTVMNGGTDPYGGFPCVYPGGTTSLKLNDDNVSGTKTTFSASATRTIAVTNANNQFQLHFAFCLLNFPHPGNFAATFKVEFFNSSNNQLLACPNFSCYYANPPGQFFGMPTSVVQTSPVQGINIGNQQYPVSYVPWQNVSIDLSAYNGQTITAKIECNWCAFDYDWGYCYIDADCAPLINATPINQCAGTLCGPPGMATYTWTPPPGGGAVQTTSCITATTPGTYVCTVTSFVTCLLAQTYTYVIYPAPVPAFTSNTVCLGSITNVNSNSSPNGGSGISNYTWDFGDGSALVTGNGANVAQHQYAAPGLHNVELKVENVGGCRDSISIPISVSPMPSADFTANNICQGGITSFTNTTQANGTNITNWYWDYTYDNVTDNVTFAPSLTYPNSGVFNVALTAVTDLGCSHTMIKAISVYSNPVAQFAFTRTCLGDATYFTDLSYVIGNNGTINSWDWDFDNNIASTEATGQFAGTTFSSYGPKTINLSISTNLGCRSSAAISMYVNPSPNVNFTSDRQAGCEPLAVTYTNQSTILNGSIATYSWSVGDNGGSTEETFTHVYPTGHYTVSLTAISDSGCVSNIIVPNYIFSYPTPIAHYTVDPQTTSILEPIVNFSNLSYGPYNQFWWYFGDKPQPDSVTANPTHFYDTDFGSEYMTTLIVRNEYACSDTTQRLVVIDPDYVMYVPNAFTPNGDGLNDIFQAKGYYIEKFNMDIFDRWGEIIFKTDDINKGWDGTVRGGSKIAENCVYVWKAIVIDVNHKRHMLTGHVTLMK
jgi:gliding motility-associated-like protein